MIVFQNKLKILIFIAHLWCLQLVLNYTAVSMMIMYALQNIIVVKVLEFGQKPNVYKCQVCDILK